MFKTDQYHETLFIDDIEYFEEDGEAFHVPFEIVSGRKTSEIPFGITLCLCDYVIGSSELYRRNPSILFGNSEANGLVAQFEIPIFLENDDTVEGERRSYFLHRISSAKKELESIIPSSDVIEISQYIQSEMATMTIFMKICDQTFSETEDRLNMLEDRLLGSYNPPSVFICHASEDREFVDKLVDQLDRHALQVWYDKREIIVGDSIVSKINSGLSEADILCVILSKSSVNKPWVERELNSTILRHLEDSRINILPVLIEECCIPPLLRDIKYANFRDSFNVGFNELIVPLKEICRRSST